MPQTSRKGPKVDSSGEQLSRRVVTEGVEVVHDVDSLTHSPVPVCHPLGLQGLSFVGEYENK